MIMADGRRVEREATTPDLGERIKADARKQRFSGALGAVMRETGRAPIFVLDKDGTLTQPRQALSPDMAVALLGLASAQAVVAVISGAEAYRLRDEVFAPLIARAGDERAGHFYLIAENGAQMYQAGEAGLDPVDRLDLKQIIGAARFAKVLGIVEETRLKFGIGDDPQRRHVVTDGSQIKLSALGNLVDEALRETFDPDGAKRAVWAQHVRARMTEEGLSDESGLIVDVIVSGTSSINLLARGVNKGHAIERLAARNGLDTQSVIYFGDRFGPGGNDVHALAHVRAAVNFGDDVEIEGVAAPVINAAEKGPDGARLYLEIARHTLESFAS